MTAANGLNKGTHGASEPMLRRCAAHVAAAIGVLLRPPRVHGQAWPFPPRQWPIAGGIVIVVFLVSMIFIDAAAIRAVARLPRWVTWSFDQITDFGKSGWFLWPLGILFLVLAALDQGKLTRISQAVLAAAMVRIGFLFLAIGVPGLFVTIVKRMIGRARPLVGGSLDPYLFAPFIWRSAYASLPSGHATTAFSVLVAFGTLWPRARTVLWIYALAIAMSRIAVTAHYPSDVLAGAVVGTVGALLVRRYFALRRLGFSMGADGTPHQFPGPSLRRIKAVARELLAP
jgi:membrane-associated phospholipid phosphatase